MLVRIACILAALGLTGCESVGSDPEMLKSDARWQVHQGQPTEALRTLRRAIEIAPRDIEAHALLAQVALRVDRPGEAEKTLWRAIQLDPRNADLRVARGVALTRLGRHREAESALLHALLLRPADPAALVSLAEVYRLSGQPEKCVSRLGQFEWQWEHGETEDEASASLRAALERARDRERYCRQP